MRKLEILWDIINIHQPYRERFINKNGGVSKNIKSGQENWWLNWWFTIPFPAKSLTRVFPRFGAVHVGGMANGFTEGLNQTGISPRTAGWCFQILVVYRPSIENWPTDNWITEAMNCGILLFGGFKWSIFSSRGWNHREDLEHRVGWCVFLWIPSSNQTWPWNIPLDVFILKPPFAGDFPLPRLIAGR